MQKNAVTGKWLRSMVTRGAEKADPGRLLRFQTKTLPNPGTSLSTQHKKVFAGSLANKAWMQKVRGQKVASVADAVGEGEESQKVESAKQKLSSVSLAAFADEIGEIKQAEGSKKQPALVRAGEAVGRRSEKLESALSALAAGTTAGGLGHLAGTARATVKHPKRTAWLMEQLFEKDGPEALMNPRVRRVAGQLIRKGRSTGFKAAIPAAAVGAGWGYGKGLFRKGYRKGQVESAR